MDKTNPTLYKALNQIKNAKRIHRLEVSNLVLKNPHLFKGLLNMVFDVDDRLSIKAAWVLEFVCLKQLEWLGPHLTYFTDNISKVRFGSAVRPLAKICELLAKSYLNKSKGIHDNITAQHIEKMIETGFDWLISNHKVAVKVYSMEMIFLFGSEKKWVHHELLLIIQQNIVHESAAYAARGKKILHWIHHK